MNKFLLITVILVLSLQQGNAQISAPKMIKGKNPATAPPSVYSLTNARVSITSCSDNKEFSPEVTVWLIQKGKGILFLQRVPIQEMKCR